MTATSAIKAFVRDWIGDNRDRLAAFEQEIWDLAGLNQDRIDMAAVVYSGVSGNLVSRTIQG